MILYQSSPGSYPAATRGVLLRAAWNAIRPTDGDYDWLPIDNQIAALPPGFSFNLAVIAGPTIPDWIKAQASLPLIAGELKGNPTTVMHYADPVWLAQADALMDALALRYGGDRRLDVLYMPWACSVNGIEGNCPPTQLPPDYADAPFADNVWHVAQTAAASLARRGNFHTRVGIELHNVNGGTAAPALLLDRMRANPVRYNTAVWWFGQGTYQVALQGLIAEAGIPCVAQPIGLYATDPNRFDDYAGVMPADTAAAAQWLITQGNDLHVRAVEVWPADSALATALYDDAPPPPPPPTRAYVF